MDNLGRWVLRSANVENIIDVIVSSRVLLPTLDVLTDANFIRVRAGSGLRQFISITEFGKRELVKVKAGRGKAKKGGKR